MLPKRPVPASHQAWTPRTQRPSLPQQADGGRPLLRRMKPIGLKKHLLFWAFALLVLTHLSQLMAKNDDSQVDWIPPIEPPGSVVVTHLTTPTVLPAVLSAQITGEISAEATPTAKPGASHEAMLRQALQSWSQAWSGQAVPQYLAMYASDFQPPQGLSRAEWARQRTQRITGKQSIQHEIRHLKVHIQGSQASTRFTQIYQDERLRAQDAKTMHWVLREGQWQITREISG